MYLCVSAVCITKTILKSIFKPSIVHYKSQGWETEKTGSGKQRQTVNGKESSVKTVRNFSQFFPDWENPSIGHPECCLNQMQTIALYYCISER